MHIKKILTVLILSCLTVSGITAQTEIPDAEKAAPLSIRPYFNIGSQITLNLASPEKSAPTPINFFIGGGTVITLTDLITLEPHLDFWMMYYLYDGKDALPAEVEHRTATTLCFMLDVPVGFNFKYGKHTLTPGAGLGLFLRFSFLANGVKPGDSGATGTAQSDTDKIAAWFWQDARFLYPEVFFSWDYEITEHFRAGLTAKIYIPMGSIISGHGMDGMIFNITSRFVF